MTRVLVSETVGKIGEQVKLKGWIKGRRDHGKLMFLDITDESGRLLQVVLPEELIKKIKLRERFEKKKDIQPAIVEITGKIVKRPADLINPELGELGKIELHADVEGSDIIAESKILPLPTDDDGYDIREDIRLKYRYLDLRRERLRQNLKFRHRIFQFIRNYLSDRGFIEIETPYLSKSTPEGARDYVVPSRLHPEKFYALPQSPQQYKQLLMIAQVGKYFQIARCFRDEDTRGDRQPEFTQLDIEMPFVEQDDILGLIKELYNQLVKELFPKKKITWKHLTYDEAIAKYKTDRPDLRQDQNDLNELAFCSIREFPMFEEFEDEDGSRRLRAVHHPFTFPFIPGESHNPEDYRYENRLPRDKLLNILESSGNEEKLKLKAFQYDIVCNGDEIGGGSIRTDDWYLLQAVLGALEYSESEIEKQFGHLIEAFKYGVSPHGGIAMGLDRFVAILRNEPNIREVIAFPKTGDGRDLMMGAPSEVDEEQLKELHIKVEPKEE